MPSAIRVGRNYRIRAKFRPDYFKMINRNRRFFSEFRLIAVFQGMAELQHFPCFRQSLLFVQFGVAKSGVIHVP